MTSGARAARKLRVARNVVVSAEFQIVEGRGNSKPAGRGSGFNARDASFADDDDISPAHRPADEYDFKLNLGVEADVARAEEEDSSRTDVARDQRDWEIFGATVYAAET
jgi:hypothetical protein